MHLSEIHTLYISYTRITLKPFFLTFFSFSLHLTQTFLNVSLVLKIGVESAGKKASFLYACVRKD